MIIPNLKTKLRKNAPIKSCFEKTSKKLTNFFHVFFSILLQIWNQHKILVPILTYLKKRVSALFFEKYYVVHTLKLCDFVLVWRGGGVREISSKMPRTVSNLPHFLRCP